MLQIIRAEWLRRPWWMNLMFLLCLYMAFIRVPNRARRTFMRVRSPNGIDDQSMRTWLLQRETG